MLSFTGILAHHSLGSTSFQVRIKIAGQLGTISSQTQISLKKSRNYSHTSWHIIIICRIYIYIIYIHMCLSYHHISSYIIIYHHISSHIIIYHHISSYIIIYHHHIYISSYSIIFHHISSYIIYYILSYIKYHISNIIYHVYISYNIYIYHIVYIIYFI